MTTNLVPIAPVVKTVTVACTPQDAFRYFTKHFGMWWPAASQSVVAYTSEFKDEPESVVLEPHVGGGVFERTRSGEEYRWGTLLAWEPPTLVAFTFHPGRDENEAQRVEVTFSPAPEGTRVELTHSGWEPLGSNAQKSRDSYNRGWEKVFVAGYREYVRRVHTIETQ